MSVCAYIRNSHAISLERHKHGRHWNRELIVTDILSLEQLIVSSVSFFFSLLIFFFLSAGESSHHIPRLVVATARLREAQRGSVIQ